MKDKEQFLEKLEDIIDIQCDSVTDEYMRGMANGLILARSIYTGKQPTYMDRGFKGD